MIVSFCDSVLRSVSISLQQTEVVKTSANFAYCCGLNPLSKTMALLLSVLRDFSVRCRKITVGLNRIQSAHS